jgi:hypothetical protein
MKQRILELINGMTSDSKSASYKCEKELCKILTSVIDKKHKIESYADRYIHNYPDKITDVEYLGRCKTLPETIWCNDDDFKFETKWLDIDWESYFEELKQSSIRGIERTIEQVEKSIMNHKERIAILSDRQFNDLEF